MKSINIQHWRPGANLVQCLVQPSNKTLFFSVPTHHDCTQGASTRCKFTAVSCILKTCGYNDSRMYQSNIPTRVLLSLTHVNILQLRAPCRRTLTYVFCRNNEIQIIMRSTEYIKHDYVLVCLKYKIVSRSQVFCIIIFNRLQKKGE